MDEMVAAAQRRVERRWDRRHVLIDPAPGGTGHPPDEPQPGAFPRQPGG
jgi:hypothetical protein